MGSTKQRPALTGLLNVMGPNVDDPLGTNVKRRGMDAYYEEARKSDPNYMSGPLPDPQWEGMFQAMDEAAGGKHLRVGMDGARPHGIADDPEFGSGLAPLSAMSDAIPAQPLMASNNLAGPAQKLAYLSGHGKALPESHEVFMARLAKKYGAR